MRGLDIRSRLFGSPMFASVLGWGNYLQILDGAPQFGAVAMASPTQSATATITAVDPTRSLLIPLGTTSTRGAADLGAGFTLLTFTNPTTITGDRGSSSGDVSAAFVVVQFQPGVWKSIQRNTIVLSGVTSNTRTVTAVDTTKAFLMSLGFNATSATTDATALAKLALTNTTTITATKNTSTDDTTVGFQLVEPW